MINGHGDDIYAYPGITSNFSSNVPGGVNHDGLNRYLYENLSCIRSYPEPEPRSLERELASFHGVMPENVCATNGATEAIYLIAQAYRNSTSVILAPTFSEYADACRLHLHTVRSLFSPDTLPAEAALVWLCNPNNPTGEVIDLRRLRKWIETHPRHLFVIDQSYEAFTDKPLFSAKEAADYPNVLLLHSLTKRFAVPGLRIGYVTAHPLLIDKLRSNRMPWSVNALAIAAGHYLLHRAEGDYALDVSALLSERKRVAEALLSVGGMDVWESDTPYMLICLRSGKAAALKEFLALNHGILIRDASNFEGLDERFFRIAVQTLEENDRLVNCIKEWMYTY